MDGRFEILEQSRFLAELSVMDYFFVPYRPSVVALAALLNAMEGIPSIPYSAPMMLMAQINHSTSMDPYAMEVNECRTRLRVHYQVGGYSRPAQAAFVPEDRDTTISPVSVAHGMVGYQQQPVSRDRRGSKCSSQKHMNY